MTAARQDPAVMLDEVPLPERADLLLDRALALGTLPAPTQELLELTRRDDAEVGPVVASLEHNPSLAAAVLRAANSPVYGQSRSVADLHRAVMVIGMQELHDVVAGTAMMAAFSRPDPLSVRLQASAVLSAAIARQLAAKLQVGSPSTAYLSGLMCEIGSLACLALDRAFAALYRAGEGQAHLRFESERAHYGATTPEIGGRILAASALPAEVAEAVATTGLEPRQATVTLGRVVAFARLAGAVLQAAAEHGDPDALRSDLSMLAATLELPGVDAEQLVDICMSAAKSAELPLRGELAIRQSQPANDVTPSTLSPRGDARMLRFAVALCAGASVGVLIWLLTK